MTDCTHPNEWFDRSICPEPCGSMHYYCTDCGMRMGRCALDYVPKGDIDLSDWKYEEVARLHARTGSELARRNMQARAGVARRHNTP